jgi:SAM-dependent methyltransferase
LPRAAFEPPVERGRLRPAGSGVVSALPAGEDGAPYDRHAQLYDQLVGNRVYNRLLWGTDPAQYVAFAREALEAGDGPFLDAGCGSAVFTADAYRASGRPIVLSDLSLAMLEKAAGRLDGAPVALVQADITALPFTPGSFETVACFAMLHVLGDPWAALAALRPQLAPGGRLFASMLVSDRAVGRGYQRLLRRAGEFGPARSAAALESAAREVFDGEVSVERTGSMAWLRVRDAARPAA